MNQLCEELVRSIRKHPLSEKWLIAPTMRAGYQLLDRVAMNGTPIVHAYPKTISRTALDIAEPLMKEQGLRLASPEACKLIAERVWHEQKEKTEEKKYLTSLPPDMDFFSSLVRTLTDIRISEVSEQAFNPHAFEVPVKGRELAALNKRYKDGLLAAGFADYPVALRLAIESLTKNGLDDDILLLVPSDVRANLNALEARFLNAVSGNQVVFLETDRLTAPLQKAALRGQDTHQTSWHPAQRAGAPEGIDIDIFPAVGAANEVREVLRRCLEEAIPLDEVEVLYTSASSYLPLFFEELEALLPDGLTIDDEPEGATFADGIPLGYSRPARALNAWLEWVDEDFPQSVLQRMIRDGLLKLPSDTSTEITFAELADLLNSVPVYTGRSNYIPKLKRHIRSVRKRSEVNIGEEENTYWNQKVEKLVVLKSMVESLLDCTPDGETVSGEILQLARAFVSERARTAARLDEYSREFLQDRIDEMLELLKTIGTNSTLEIKEWLLKTAEEGRVAGSGPRPGCLHVAPLDSGGHSGRLRTFIVGLDDAHFPPSPDQDPILLDSERKKLSKHIATSEHRLEKHWRVASDLLAGLRGHITLSYSYRDIKNESEQFPGAMLIAIYRRLSENPKGDQSDFLHWDELPEPVSFATDARRPGLDEAGWWIGRLCDRTSHTDRSEEVMATFPHLSSGLAAIKQRESTEFTCYDGRIDEISPLETGMDVLSSSRLETLGACPLRYFFQNVLRLELPAELRRDPDEWLDPMEKGKLLHEVFYKFMAGLFDEGLSPELDRDWSRLADILEEAIESWTQRTPPPRPEVLAAQRRELVESCRIFLTGAQQLGARSRPVYLESDIGMGTNEGKYTLKVPQPVPLILPGGKKIKARGRLDRIDQIVEGEGGEEYEIWDYKTGSAGKYSTKPGKIFNQGRVLQHALYMNIAQKCLHQHVSPCARIRWFGYIFTKPGESEEPITYTPEELKDGLEFVDRLTELAENGAFIATNESKDCRFCDCEIICRNGERLAEQSQRKMDNVENELLRPFCWLRDNE